MEREGNRIIAQVQEECEEMKRKATEEADNIRMAAADDARKTKEGAELYALRGASKILNGIIILTSFLLILFFL